MYLLTVYRLHRYTRPIQFLPEGFSELLFYVVAVYCSDGLETTGPCRSTELLCSCMCP